MTPYDPSKNTSRNENKQSSIFQQFKAPQMTQNQKGQEDEDATISLLQQQNQFLNHQKKQQIFENYGSKNLQKSGKQAIKEAGMNLMQKQDHEQNQDFNHSFEEASSQFYGVQKKLKNSPPRQEQFGHEHNNNLNSGLIQQKQRGQKRHFHNEVTNNLFFDKSVHNLEKSETEVKEAKEATTSSSGQGRMRRAPYISNIVTHGLNSPGHQLQMANSGASNVQVNQTVPQSSKMDDNQQKKKQKSVFDENQRQKSRKLVLQMQNYSLQKTENQNDQIMTEKNEKGEQKFKSVFPQSALLGQYGSNVLHPFNARSSPKASDKSGIMDASMNSQILNSQGVSPNAANTSIHFTEKTNATTKNSSQPQVYNSRVLRKQGKNTIDTSQDQQQMQVLGTSFQKLNDSIISGTDRTSQLSDHRESREQKIQGSGKKKRHLSILNKTDEKQKVQAQDASKNHKKNNVLTTQKDFRKYKRNNWEDQDKQEINVLGQPLQPIQQYSQNKNEDIQSMIDTIQAQRIGTGLFPKKSKFSTRLHNQMQTQQTGLNLPSMRTSDVTAGATSGTGGGLNSSSFQKQQGYPRKRKQSIFSTSGFSANPENVLQDLNYTMKGSQDNQRIAWEIQFHQSNKKEKDKDDNINVSSYQEESKVSKKNNSFKFTRQNVSKNTTTFQADKSMISNHSNNNYNGNNLPQPPLSTTNARSNTNKFKVMKLAKINKKISIPPSSNPNRPTRLQSLSPTKSKSGGGGGIKGQTLLVNQMRGQPLEQTNDNSGVFKRQNKGPLRVNQKGKYNINKSQVGQQAFRNGRINKIKVEESPAQTIGQLPSELIVTGYKQQSCESPVKTDTRKTDYDQFLIESGEDSFIREASNLNDNLKGKQKNQVIFSYQDGRSQKTDEDDFFDKRSGREFDEFMAQTPVQERQMQEEYIRQQKNRAQTLDDSDLMIPSTPQPIPLLQQATLPNSLNRISKETIQSNQQLMKKSQTSRPSQCLNLGRSHTENNSSENQIKSALNLRVVQMRSKENLVILSSNSVEIVGHKQGKKPAQSAVHAKNRAHLIKNQSKWSGGITTQTQLKFCAIINQNLSIKEKLDKLKERGIKNESNSLFQTIIADIKKVAKNQNYLFSHSDIVNCIKNSSLGNPHSALEYKSVTTIQGKNINILQMKAEQIKMKNNSEGNSFQYNNSSDKNAQTFKKSRSQLNIKKNERPGILSEYRHQNFVAKIDPTTKQSLYFPPLKKASQSFKQIDNFVNEKNEKQGLTLLKHMNYIHNENSVPILQKSKIYLSHANLPHGQITSKNLHGVQSEKQLDSKIIKNVNDIQPIQSQNSNNPIVIFRKDPIQNLIKNKNNSGDSDEQKKAIPYMQKFSRYIRDIESEVQSFKAIKPGESGNSGSDKPKIIHIKNTLIKGSQPSQSSSQIPFLKQCSSGNGDQKSFKSGQKTNSSGDKNSYTLKFHKQSQILYYNKLEASQIKTPEPVEHGKIIRWRQGEVIGLGSSSVVYAAIRVDNNKMMAVKKFKVVSDVSGVDQKKLLMIKNEIQKYKKLDHENIVKFYGCELLDQFFCIYLEQMDTSLAHVLSEYGNFEEDTIQSYTKQILLGLQCLHNNKIKHLDLKCSNILTNNDGDGIIKLCDFGSSREFKKGSANGSSAASCSFSSLHSQILGSVQWMAPEVITEQGCGSKSDIWSLGCTIVEMFVGGVPWGDKIDEQNLYQAQQIITNSDILPCIPASREVSAQCTNFLNLCLTRDYDARPSIDELLKHPWILAEQ